MIVILTQCFPPVLGGIETLVGGLADALAGAGRGVMVLADGRGGAPEAAHDGGLSYPVRRFAGFKPLRRRRKARAAAGLLRTSDVAAAFADSWKSAELVADSFARSGIPLVCLAHGNDVLTGDDGRRRGRIAGVLARTHRIAAVSSGTARMVARLGVDPGRVTVVHPGVVPPVEPGADAAARIAGRLAGRRPVLLTVARIEPRKGQDQMLRALPSLIADHPELVYAVAGDGAYRRRLEELAGELGVAGHVEFLGRVSEADKSALLDAADLMVMPVREDAATRSVEGFGLVYAEAAFRGLPAVGGRSGGVEDVIRDGDTGLLCDGDDADDIARTVRAALADPARLACFGEAARAFAEREFAWPVAVRRYLACIE